METHPGRSGALFGPAAPAPAGDWGEPAAVIEEIDMANNLSAPLALFSDLASLFDVPTKTVGYLFQQMMGRRANKLKAACAHYTGNVGPVGVARG